MMLVVVVVVVAVMVVLWLLARCVRLVVDGSAASAPDLRWDVQQLTHTRQRAGR